MSVAQVDFGSASEDFPDFLESFSAKAECSSGTVGMTEGLPEGPLGNTAKYVGRSAAREQRKALYFLQRGAAGLLPDERVASCRWSVQRRDQPIEVHLHEQGFASYSGLQTCGSVWLCPVCSKRISETRRQELNTLLAWAREHNFIPVMVTLTARHALGDDLGDQLAQLKAAKRRLRQRRDWKNLRDRIVGTVTGTEVTHGSAAGWHTHFHEVVIVRADSEAEAVALLSSLASGWVSALRSQGLDGIEERAWQVQGAAAAGNYLGKWGAAEELAFSGQKKGRKGGRTAAELLYDAVMKKDERAGRLWQEFGRVFKGSRQLVWSDGLKVLAGIDEVADDQAAQDGEAKLVGLIDYDDWRGSVFAVGAKYRRVRILEAAERGGPDAVMREVHTPQQTHDDDLTAEQHDVLEDPQGVGVEGLAPTHQVTLEGPTKWEDTKSPYEQGNFAHDARTFLASGLPHNPREGPRWRPS